MKKIRVLIIGCGYIAQAQHIPNWLLSPSGVIAGVVDTREEMARSIGEELGVPWFTEVEQAFASVSCDAVHISTPAFTHTSLIVAAAKHGLHIIVEKPLAEMAQDAQLAVDSAQKAGVILMVGYPRLFDADFRQLGNWIKNGDLGVICGLQSVWKLNLPGVYRKYSNLPRTTLIEKEISPVEQLKYRLREESIHHLSLFRTWFGTPIKISAAMARRSLLHVSLAYGEGIPAWHTNASPAGHGEEIWAYGEKAFGYSRPYSPHFPWIFGHSEISTRESGGTFRPDLARINPYAKMLEEFTSSIVEKRAPFIEPQGAVDDLKLVDQIAECFLRCEEASQVPVT